MSFTRLQMQRGTGKMRNRSGVATHGQFLCLYSFSSPGLFCPQFLFLLIVCLSVALGLFSSLPFSLAPWWGPGRLCLSWPGCASPVTQSPLGTWGAPWPLQDPAECLEGDEGAGTATSILGWAEPWSRGRMGRCQGPFWHPSCCEDRDTKCYFCSSALAWSGSSLRLK